MTARRTKRHGRTIRRGSAAWWESEATRLLRDREALVSALDASRALHGDAMARVASYAHQRDNVAAELAALRADVEAKRVERERDAANFYDRLEIMGRERDEARATLRELALTLEVREREANGLHDALRAARAERSALAVALRVVGDEASEDLRDARLRAPTSGLGAAAATEARCAELVDQARKGAP